MPRTYGKKKQTRLTFAPIPEGSAPNGESSSPLRPAKLRYTQSPSRRIFAKGQLQLEDYTSRPLNDVKSSPVRESSDDNNKDSITAGTPTKTKQKQSSTPSFPHPVSGNHLEAGVLSSDEEVIRPSKRRRKFKTIVTDNESDQKSQSSFTSQRRERQGSSEKEVMAKKSKIIKPHKTLLQRGKNGDEDSTDSSTYSAPKTRSIYSKKRRLSSSGSSQPRKKSLVVDLTGLGEVETSDGEELVTVASSSRKRKIATQKARDPFIVDDDEDSESDIVIATPKRKTSKSKLITKEEDSTPVVDDLDESSDDVVTSTPARRALRKSPHTPSGRPGELQRTPSSLRMRQDELDIQEDLEDLMDTAVKRNRTRGAAVNSERSKRQRHLELLRRRRAGEKDSTNTTDSANAKEDEEFDEISNGGSHHLNDSSDMVEFPVHGDYDEDDDEEDSDVESEIDANEDLDRDDASFVEEDDEIGVPVTVPFEFSRHRTKQPRECFRDVVEWMVHNKLNPAFARHDEIYQFAFKKLDDEVVGRAGSQLISSVWNADFRNALRARPYIDVSAFPTSANYSCAACNRSNHPASSDIKLFGPPYSEDTLEPLFESDSDEDEDEDEDEEHEGGEKARDRDREGHLLPPEDRHFYLGKHCKANAVLTHTLLHWRFHLYEWVVDYLDAKEGLSDPQRTVEREKLSMRKRSKNANNVVDMMDNNGEIQRLWRDFHHTLKAAREKKEFSR